MKLKPKGTVGNKRGLLYKRYIDLEQDFSGENVYYIAHANPDNPIVRFYMFDKNLVEFVEIYPQNEITRGIELDTTKYYRYGDFFFKYSYEDQSPYYGEWTRKTKNQLTDLEIQSSIGARYGNIGKYQLNKYYYYGSFDFIIKGSIEGTTAQYLKGNIIPLNSFNIKTFNDDVHPEIDDLVVIDGKLYSVENPERTIKQMPKPYNIYFATLNNIL